MSVDLTSMKPVQTEERVMHHCPVTVAPEEKRAMEAPRLYLTDRGSFPEARRHYHRPIPSGTQPRWHTQSFMLFLALRQQPNHSLPRTDLIQAALSLDKKISEEYSLPKVFRGKTPVNSASAILSNNSDHRFIPFKPPGSRSMHFRLANKPNDREIAAKEYHTWVHLLIKRDWPNFFTKPIPRTHDTVADLAVSSYRHSATEFDQFLASRRRHRSRQREECPSKINHTKRLSQELPLIQQDLSNVPKRWQDIVAMDNGVLYAVRHIPASIPLGFYFGVPTNEDEFNLIKYDVGQAAKLCMKYQCTVLDPTNDEGLCIKDPNDPMFCPFHFVQAIDSDEKANVVFLEGPIPNQIVCWSAREIPAGQTLRWKTR